MFGVLGKTPYRCLKNRGNISKWKLFDKPKFFSLNFQKEFKIDIKLFKMQLRANAATSKRAKEGILLIWRCSENTFYQKQKGEKFASPLLSCVIMSSHDTPTSPVWKLIGRTPFHSRSQERSPSIFLKDTADFHKEESNRSNATNDMAWHRGT